MRNKANSDIKLAYIKRGKFGGSDAEIAADIGVSRATVRLARLALGESIKHVYGGRYAYAPTAADVAEARLVIETAKLWQDAAANENVG